MRHDGRDRGRPAAPPGVGEKNDRDDVHAGRARRVVRAGRRDHVGAGTAGRRRAASVLCALLVLVPAPAATAAPPAAAYAGPAAGPGGAPRTAAAWGADRAAAQVEAEALGRSVGDVQARLDEALARYDELQQRVGVDLPASVASLRHADAARDAEREARQARARHARELYVHGRGLSVVARLLEDPDIADLATDVQTVRSVLDGDESEHRARREAAREADDAAVRQRAVASEATRLQAEAARTGEEVSALLAQQQALYDDASERARALLAEQQEAERREAAERQAREALAAALAREAAAREAEAAARTAEAEARAASGSAAASASLQAARAEVAAARGDVAGAGFAGAPPLGADGMACPAGPTRRFSDTWGAARSGGRRHQGTDVMAARGSPAYAVADGVIDKASVVDRGLGGITLWLRSDAGDRYYYAHHDRNLVTVGQRVRAGQQIAVVGNTGNARTTPSHIHFELHPHGGPAVNPYPLLRRLCG